MRVIKNKATKIVVATIPDGVAVAFWSAGTQVGDTFYNGITSEEYEVYDAGPAFCTRRQGRLALLAQGLLDDVELAIAAITSPLEQRAAQIEYEADTWDRDNPFVQLMWAQLGGTPEQLDDLFRMAVAL